MPKSKFTISNIDQLPALAAQIIQVAGNLKVFVFYAEMGTGKTTLIKEICKQLGTTDNLSSPTYSIVNEYHLPDANQKIYHIDLYRLKNTEDAIAIGLEDYLYSGNYCFIEWPELAEPLLPERCVKITMERDNDLRKIAIFIGL